MMYAAKIQPDATQWDAFVKQHSRAYFLQMSEWGALKSEFGWTSQRVALTDSTGNLVAGAQILYRQLPLRLGKLAYIPFGPLVDWDNRSLVEALFSAIDQAACQSGAVFMKLEPGYEIDTSILQSIGCRPSPQNVQPPRTLILDISGDDDAILKQMNQGTRRNIRKSQKFNVHVRVGNRADVDSFNRLLHITGERQDFGVHVPIYYEQIYQRFTPPSSSIKAALLMASFQDEGMEHPQDLSGVFVFVLGSQSWYLYGASSNQERKRMASFGVQWASIQWAREQGATSYDMYGVPDFESEVLEARFAEEHDRLWGVYRFKRGWGGQVVRTVGAWDRIYRKPVYWAYRAYLRLRKGDDPQ